MKLLKELKVLLHRRWTGIPVIMWLGALSGLLIGAAGGFCFWINRGPSGGLAGAVLLGYAGIHIGFGVGSAIYEPKKASLGAVLTTLPCWPMLIFSPPQLEQEWAAGILLILFAASIGASLAVLLYLFISHKQKK